MYSDPSNIRDIIVQVRLNDAEAALLTAITEFTGQQRSTMLRELFIEQATLVLSGRADVGLIERRSEATLSRSVAAR